MIGEENKLKGEESKLDNQQNENVDKNEDMSNVSQDELEENKENNESELPMEREIEENPIEKKTRFKKLKIGVSVFAILLLGIYFIGVLYFKSHFFFRSYINNIPVSAKSITATNNKMIETANTFILSIIERNEITEEIKGSDIGLKYDFSKEASKLIDNQNPFLWVNALFTINEHEIKDNISYDEMLLKKAIAELQCLNPDNVQEPVDAYINYNGNEYEIVKEVMGNKIDTEKFDKVIRTNLINMKSNLNLEDKKCYINPIYTAETTAVINSKDILDKYINSKITYNINGQQEVVDKALISTWINVDDKFDVNFDVDKIKEYVDTLGSKYDNIGKVQELTRITGEKIKISKSSNIYYIDRKAQVDNIIANIESGSEVTADLILKTPDVTDNYVINTFIEIDLTNQHVYFYKNGNLLVDGSCVTGNVSAGHTTPPGVFKLTYKQKNATLRGVGYATPVAYWMPFNGGIGLHDATWRSSFGGQIYKTNGSHGCINLPLNVARTIYENLDSETTIICRN